MCPGYLGLGCCFQLAFSLPRLGLPGHDCYIFFFFFLAELSLVVILSKLSSPFIFDSFDCTFLYTLGVWALVRAQILLFWFVWLCEFWLINLLILVKDKGFRCKMRVREFSPAHLRVTGVLVIIIPRLPCFRFRVIRIFGFWFLGHSYIFAGCICLF